MTSLKHIAAIVIVITFIRASYGRESFSSKLMSNDLVVQKYEVGFGLHSHFHDYQLGGFYESKLEIIAEVGKNIVGSSFFIGLKIDQSLLSDNSKKVVSGGIYTHSYVIPYVRYHLIKGLFLEAGVGGGYGFSLSRNVEGDFFKDWRNVFYYHHHIATGFDFHLKGNEKLIIRPTLYYRFRSSYIPSFPSEHSKGKTKEFGFTINFIINFYKPKN